MNLTAPQAQARLQEAADRARRFNVSLWDDFMAAFHAYSATVTDDLVRSPPESLSLAQGRAQECARIVRYLTEAPAAVSKAVARKTAP